MVVGSKPWRAFPVLDMIAVWRRWKKSVVLSILDQVAMSGGNFFLNVLLARWLSPNDYGAFAIAFVVFLFLSGFHNAFIVEPMSVLEAGKSHEEIRKTIFGLVRLHFFLTAIGSSAIAISVLLVEDTSLRNGLFGVAIILPFVLLSWLLRRALYLITEPMFAARSSAVYLVMLLSAVICLHAMNFVSILGAFLAMGIASFGSSAISWRRLRPIAKGNKNEALDDQKRIMRSYWHYGKWGGIIAIMQIALYPIQTILPGAYLGLQAAGVLRALQNVMLPIMQVMTAVSTLFLPVVSADFNTGNPRKGIKRSYLVTGGLVLLALLNLSLIIVFRTDVDRLLYNGKYSSFVDLMPLLALSPVFSALAVAFTLIFRANQTPKHAVVVNALVIPFSLVTAFWWTLNWGLTGIVGSIVVTSCIGMLIAFLVYRFRTTKVLMTIAR